MKLMWADHHSCSEHCRSVASRFFALRGGTPDEFSHSMRSAVLSQPALSPRGGVRILDWIDGSSR